MSAIAAIDIAPPPCANIEREVSADARERRSGAMPTGIAERLTAREPGALEELYDRFASVTFGFLLNTLRDRSLAEDVQQQVFLEVWQRAATYDPQRGSLLTWVMTIARSRAIDQLRRRVPEPIGEAAELGSQSEADEVDELVERYRIAGLLSRLHPQEAEILRLRFYDDLPQSEIAKRTGIPLGTVKMRMVAGLGRLREMIEVEA